VERKTITYSDCLRVAKDFFNFLFKQSVEDLTKTLPKDYINPDGKPLWSGYYRFPSPLLFNLNEDNHISFVMSTARIYAKMFNVAIVEDFYKVAQDLESIKEHQNIFIQENEESTDLIIKKLETIASLEKKINDILLDDQNERPLYSEFVSAAVSLKAKCYGIPECPKHKIEKLTFNLKMNLPLTNSVIIGLICLEIYKIWQKKPLDNYKNYHLNLAINSYTAEPPARCIKKSLDPNINQFTVWDKLSFDVNTPVSKILEVFNEKYGGKITKLFYETIVFYDAKTPGETLDKIPKEMIEKNGRSDIFGKKMYLELHYDLDMKENVKMSLPRIKYNLS